jgi:hypothetical protein
MNNKSISNNVSSRLSNTETSLPIPIQRASNYLDNLKVRIKNNLSSNLKTYLMVAIPILVIIIYIGFKYNFNARNVSSIAAMSYPTQINATNLSSCSSLDISMQYKLCDYYISSSYMTPCVGNQHYDYVSVDYASSSIWSAVYSNSYL